MTDSSDKIKILYVIPTLDYGGAERQLLELCGHIDRDVFDPTIILLTDRDQLWAEQYQNTPHIKIIKIRHTGKYNLLKLFELSRIFKQLRPHIVHTYLPTANLWGCLSAKLFRKSIVVASARGLHYRIFNRWYLMNLLSLNLLADFVVVNSIAVENNCADFLKVRRDKIVKIINGVNVAKDCSNFNKERASEDFGISHGGIPVISSIGRLDCLKGFPFLIKAASILISRGMSATFLIAGDGHSYNKLKDQIKELGLDSRVRLLGNVENADKLLSITDIFVLPTLSEGCSNVILEAMASGAAIITTAIPANEELIENNHTGLLVPPRDAEALSEAMEKFIKLPSLARKAGENARKKAQKDFSIGKMISRYQEFYFCVTGKGA